MPIEPIVSTEDGDSGTLNVRISGTAWCWARIARIILGRVCKRLGGGLKGRGAFRVEFESEIFSVEDGEVLQSSPIIMEDKKPVLGLDGGQRATPRGDDSF